MGTKRTISRKVIGCSIICEHGQQIVGKEGAVTYCSQRSVWRVSHCQEGSDAARVLN